jgi:hypothetical protein
VAAIHNGLDADASDTDAASYRKFTELQEMKTDAPE